MNYLKEEELFIEEAKLEKFWGNPIVLIYTDLITVIPQEKNYKSHYIPFIYKGKQILLETYID